MLSRKDKANQSGTTDRPATPLLGGDTSTIGKAPTPQVARRARLGEIDRANQQFFLRDKGTLAEASLKGLMDAIQHEGLQDPIEVAILEGRVVLVKGFLRVEACVLMGRKQVPGFGDDMELDAIEVQETDPNELLIRSVLDNSHRRSLDQVERIEAARRLFLAGINEARAAEALGVSTQSYKRDLAIAECPWMFRHDVNSEISPTPASTLLRAIAEAEKEHPGTGARFRAELADWIEEKKALIDRRDRIAKAKKGKASARPRRR